MPGAQLNVILVAHIQDFSMIFQIALHPLWPEREESWVMFVVSP